MLPKLSFELNSERDYIFLWLSIPIDGDNNYKDDILNLLKNYIEKIACDEITSELYIPFCKVYLDSNILSLYGILNEIRETIPKFRYRLSIKLKSKKYPTEISINNKDKVILTKQRTKMSSF